MALWRLQPLDLADPSWEASSHRGTVIVRAPDEAAAREQAQRAFGIKTRFSPGAGIKAPPWLRPALVAVEPVHDPRYEEEGPTEILDPSFPLESP
jgi:hypothetical protein